MALDYIAIDFETSNTYPNSACSVALVRFKNGIETDSVYSLIHPAKMYFIPEWTQDIHHISYQDVINKPKFPEIWKTIMLPFINQSPALPLVAHNASFDMGVIKACCQYYNLQIKTINYFDSLKVARKTWAELKCHKLTFLGEHFGIKYLAHDALEDSRTCGKIIALATAKHKVQSVCDLLKACNLKMEELSVNLALD